MLPTVEEAHLALEKAGQSNPGPWLAHSRYVAEACRNIARAIPGMDAEKAYLLGLLHDIGRYPGVTSERHLIDGYRYCMERGWQEIAKICITHAFMVPDIASSIGVFDMPPEDKAFIAEFVKKAVYDDYDCLVQLCDSLAFPSGFCILEKRFVDVTIRYGVHPYTVERWKAVLSIQRDFEERMGKSIYDCLPGVKEHTFSRI